MDHSLANYIILVYTNASMKLHIAKNQLDIANPEIIQHICLIANLTDVPQDQLHTYLSISVLLELLNSQINEDFHITLMRREAHHWLAESYIYRVEDKELVDTLWRAVQYCFDEKTRKAEIEEREKVWRQSETELVHVKNAGRGV